MQEVPRTSDRRPGWQQLAETPWATFRRLPAWAQVIGWLVGFWMLPAAWLFARAKGPAGVAGAVAAAAFGLVVVAAAAGSNTTTGPSAGAVATAEPAPTPTVATSTSPTPSSEPSPSPSTSLPPPPTPGPEPLPSPTPLATPPPDDVAGVGALPADGQATTVERIVDGDTLYLAGLAERARLIGIDTPETVAPGRPIECFGPEASAHLAELVPPGTEVVVSRDVELFDRYDRPLIYLYRASDGMFINEVMLMDGFAQMVTYPPNVAHVDTFQEAQRVAREAGNGLWGAACSDGEDQAVALGGAAAGGAASGSAASGSAASGSGGVVIARVNWDGPGNDVEFNTSEHVVLRNDSAAAVDVGGWSLSDEVDHRIVISNDFVIPPGGELRVHTGPGDQADDAHHDGQSQAIWNNSGGDTVTLRDAAGTIIDEQSYSS